MHEKTVNQSNSRDSENSSNSNRPKQSRQQKSDKPASSPGRTRRNTLAARREKAQVALEILQETYADAKCGLNFSSPFELLVATVLSAQTTDARVNLVTPELFRQYPTPEALAAANMVELSQVIRSIGLYQRKAASLKGLGEMLVADFGGEVPKSRDELTKLPGVGRKTANVVLGNCFGQEEITVDTHVGRLSRRLKWAKSTNPEIVERELWKLLPDAPWTQLCHQLIAHGRAICHSRKPECGRCPLLGVCDGA